MDDELPLRISIGDKYGPAMEITDQAAADACFARLVEHGERVRVAEGLPPDRAEVERVEKINLGYYAGYYDADTRRRVESLFRCAHPFFGTVAANGTPTADTAFNIGRATGAAGRGAQ